MRLRVLSVLAALLLAAQAADPASAAWPTSAAGTSRALGGSIAAPTMVEVTWDPVVHVSWTASASSWATGYRVLRSVHPQGPYTQVADVGAAVTTVDDSPGAGTHHYAVVAYRGSWTSALSGVAVRADPTYVFKGSSAFTATHCAAAAGGSFDMQQGWSTAGGTTLRKRRSDDPIAFCSDTFTSGQTIPAGTTTVSLWIENTAGASCDVTATLSLDGSTPLGSGTLTVPTKSELQLRTFTFPTSSAAPATGQRVRVVFTWQSVGSCNYTWLTWGGPTTGSSLTLPA